MQKRKNRVIIALAAIVGFMAVGYALLSQELTINGTANIDAKWQVEITGIESEFANGGSNAKGEEEDEILPTFTGTTATFNASLTQPGSQATYIVTVTNNGTIPAHLTEVPTLDTINGQLPSQIQYAITVVDDKMDLQPGESAQVAVIAAWPDVDTTVPEGPVSKQATITLNYEQMTDGED